MTAMTAATIDQLSDGRMLLGIGSSGPQVAEGWHGAALRQAAPAHARVRRGRADGAGARAAWCSTARRSSCRCPTGPGKALKLTIAPVQERIPIYLAAIGPKNTTLAAEIADGWIPTLFSPEHVGEFRAAARGGLRARRRRQGLRRLRHRPDRQRDRHRRRRVRARRDAPLRRALRRRHGLAQAELLQRARAALRLRGRRARGPGPLPGGQARTRRRRRCRASCSTHVSLCGPPRRRARAAGGLPRRRASAR